MGAGDRIQVLYLSSECSSPLSHLPSPWFQFYWSHCCSGYLHHTEWTVIICLFWETGPYHLGFDLYESRTVCVILVSSESCSNIPVYPKVDHLCLNFFSLGQSHQGSVSSMPQASAPQIFLCLFSEMPFLCSLLLILSCSSFYFPGEGGFGTHAFSSFQGKPVAWLSVLTWRLSLYLRCMVFSSSFGSMYFWISPETPSLPMDWLAGVCYPLLFRSRLHCALRPSHYSIPLKHR